MVISHGTRMVVALGAAAILFPGAAAQAQFIYGNGATFGTEHLYKFDATTGAVVKSCPVGKGNGRGIVVVSGIAYYTTANSNNVYKADMNTCADLGVAFVVTGASALSTMAYDGTNFWIGDYSGTNKAYYYSPTGTLLKTITLANCTQFCDGLEFFNGKLISNRVDGCCNGTPVPYDVYDTNGTLLTPAFISAAFPATGIAFDGTNFFVSDFNNKKLDVYDGTTGAFIKTITLTGMDPGDFIEDLSADYAVVIGPSGPVLVPTLKQWALIALAGLLALFGVLALRRRMR